MSDLVKQDFIVYGMSCMGCVRGVTGAVRKVAGVANVDVSLDDSTAAVEYDAAKADPAAIVAAIAAAGFDAKPR